MPARGRVHAEAFTVSAARNYWEFPAAPIDADAVRADYTDADGKAMLTLEPYDLVVWEARWYLVAFEPGAGRWRAMRVDRLEPRMPTGTPFQRRGVPHGDPAAFVLSTHDRGDTPAEWPCRGSALLALPAPVAGDGGR